MKVIEVLDALSNAGCKLKMNMNRGSCHKIKTSCVIQLPTLTIADLDEDDQPDPPQYVLFECLSEDYEKKLVAYLNSDFTNDMNVLHSIINNNLKELFTYDTLIYKANQTIQQNKTIIRSREIEIRTITNFNPTNKAIKALLNINS